MRLAPNSIEALAGRGQAYLGDGDHDRAIADFDAAILSAPNRPDVWRGRADVFAQQGQYARAIDDYEKALRIDDENAAALNALAWLLATTRDATFRDGRRAIELAERAVRLDEAAAHHDTLAAAYATDGRYMDAEREQRRSVRIMRDKGLSGDVTDAENRLDLYLQKKPYRE